MYRFNAVMHAAWLQVRCLSARRDGNRCASIRPRHRISGRVASRDVAALLGLGFVLAWLASAPSAIHASPPQETPEQVFALAANRYSLEDWDRATGAFLEVIDRFPNTPQAVMSEFFVGECLVQQGRYGEAHPHYLAYVEAKPQSDYVAQAVYRVGETAYLSANMDVAEQWLTTFLHDHAQHELAAYAHPYLGDVYFERQQFAKARTHYINALTDYPQSPLVDHCRMGMARIFEIEGKPDESLRFLKLISESSNPLAGDALYETLRLHREAGDSSQVRQVGAAYLQRFTQGSYANAVRILVAEAEQVDGDIDAAFRWVNSPEHSWELEDQRVNEVAPGVLFRLAKAGLENGSEADAHQLLEQIQTHWPQSNWSDDALELLIRNAEASDQHDELRALTDRFIATYPQSDLLPYVRELQGRCLYDEKAFPEAEAVFAAAWKQLQTRDDVPADFRANLLYLHGLSLIATERDELAIEQLEQALPLLEMINQQTDLKATPSPLRSGIQLALATAYSRLQRHQEAAASREAFLELETDTVAARDCAIDLVLNYLEVDDLSRAEFWCGWLTEHFPPESEQSSPRWDALLQNVAESAFIKSQWAIAESVFGMLAQHAATPESRAKGHSGIAWAKYKQDDFAGAADAFEASVNDHATGEVAAEACYLLGRLCERSGDLDAALQWYSRIEAAHASSNQIPDSIVRRARILKQRDDAAAREQGLEFYDRALELDAGETDVLLYEKAWLLLELDRESDAYATFDVLVKNHRQSRFWCDAAYRLAEHLTESDQYDKADPLLQEILARDDAEALRPFASYLMGQNAARRNAWRNVLAAMDAVVELPEPHALTPAAWYWKGEAHFRLDEHQEAETSFRKLTAESDAVDPSWLPTIRLRMAQITALRGDWAGALQQAKQMGEAKQDLAQPYELDYLIGRCLSSLGRFTEARDAYAEVIRSPIGARTETAAKSQWMIGESYFHQEHWDDAIDAFEKVEVLYGYPQWQAAAILQAGKCHEQAGRWKQAVKLYARLLREHPDSEFVAEASERLKTTGQRNRTQR